MRSTGRDKMKKSLLGHYYDEDEAAAVPSSSAFGATTTSFSASAATEAEEPVSASSDSLVFLLGLLLSSSAFAVTLPLLRAHAAQHGPVDPHPGHDPPRDGGRLPRLRSAILATGLSATDHRRTKTGSQPPSGISIDTLAPNVRSRVTERQAPASPTRTSTRSVAPA